MTGIVFVFTADFCFIFGWGHSTERPWLQAWNIQSCSYPHGRKERARHRVNHGSHLCYKTSTNIPKILVVGDICVAGAWHIQPHGGRSSCPWDPSGLRSRRPLFGNPFPPTMVVNLIVCRLHWETPWSVKLTFGMGWDVREWGHTSLRVTPERYHEVSGHIKALMLSQTQIMGIGESVRWVLAGESRSLGVCLG